MPKRGIIFGAHGLLGSELLRQLSSDPRYSVTAITHAELDMTDRTAVEKCFEQYRPHVVWNCVAYNAVDAAEAYPTEAYAVNETVPKLLAAGCERWDCHLVHFSSGYVFDGSVERGYVEDDQPRPLSTYGHSKLAGERAVIEGCSRYHVIRLNWLFGKPGTSAHAKKTFPDIVLDLARARSALRMVSDEHATPTYSLDLSRLSIDMVQNAIPSGIYHGSNTGQASWVTFAEEVLHLNHIDLPVIPISASSLHRPAKRPHHSVLLNTKLPVQRDWREALAAYYNDTL